MIRGSCDGGPLHRKMLAHPEPRFVQWSDDGKRWQAWTGNTPPDVPGAELAAYEWRDGRWRWMLLTAPETTL